MNKRHMMSRDMCVVFMTDNETVYPTVRNRVGYSVFDVNAEERVFSREHVNIGAASLRRLWRVALCSPHFVILPSMWQFWTLAPIPRAAPVEAGFWALDGVSARTFS